MQKTKKVLFISTLLISLTLVSCNQEHKGNYAYEYDHHYDNLKISDIKSQASNYTYKDYEANSIYTELRYPFSYAPSKGDVKFLVIPVWFDDSTQFISMNSRHLVRSDIEKAYLGKEEDTGWESVSTYYQKDSFGKLNISGVVTDWYETGDSVSNYYTDGNATANLLVKAVNWAREQYGNLTEFDSDNDGFLDSVILIYAAPESQNLRREIGSGNYSNMWAYTNFLMDGSKKNKKKPGPNTFFWASYDFMYSYGSDASDRTGQSSSGLGDTTVMSIDSHTFIHETGHLFGLPDYYDYSGQSSPALGFSMQDENVGAHDPYSRFSLGWADAIVPTKTSKIKLSLMEDSGKFILLTNKYNNSAFDEYIILELYSPTGLNKFDTDNTYRTYYPSGPQKTGIRMWHVDSRLYSIEEMDNYGNITAGHLTANPDDGGILNATNNTSSYASGATDLAGNIYYNQLEVVRRNYLVVDKNGGYVYPSDTSRMYFPLIDNDLFVTGDFFSMEQYQKQFVNGVKLNNESKLKWSVYFDKVTDTEATITVIKR